MRMRKWIVSGAIVGVAAIVAAPVAQTANPKSSRKAVRAKADPAATSDKNQVVKGAGEGTHPRPALGKGVALQAGLASRLALRDRTVAVMIQLSDAPAAVSYGLARTQALAGAAPGADTKQANKAAAAAGRTQLGVIERAQTSVLSSLSRMNVRVLYRTQKAYNGIAARVSARDIPQIRRMPGVKAVRMLVPKKMDNWNSVPFVGAPTAWTKGLGYRGEGIKVGVIDTGIDYLHANFGGPGAAAEYGDNDTTVVGDAPNYPGVKVAGGHDFVGDDYDGDNDPVPDDDPMDCNGHGSHVAGTIGGYGVKADGSTFTGPYGAGSPFASLKIGPGVAPDVKLYGLRVFGCDGSTNVTTQAIDWAVDPNGDGDFSDHLDVVNMSLGSGFGGPEDDSAVASDNAALAGVIVVASAGNNGDTYYITGSPAVAPRAISVAASLDKAAIVSGFDVNSENPENTPTIGTGTKPAAEASFEDADGNALPWPGDVTGDLAVSSPVDGCTTISGVSGKIALIARGTCTFLVKYENAQAAGATGVLVTNNVAGFPFPMAGEPDSYDRAAMMTDLTTGDALRASITAGNTINVTLTDSHQESIQSVQPAVEDRIASFSSRGPSRGNALKPDISSIGESVFSTEALSGTEGDSFNGTSMSSPHVAGTMAILKQFHPTWTPEELKALVMNNANHDVFLGLAATPKIGPGRIGAGREDVANAVNTNVIAYSDDGSGRVSVAFGSVEVKDNPTVLTRTVKVANKGKTSATYTVGYFGGDANSMPDIPGVTISASPGSVNVDPGATETVTVTFSADPTLMKHSRDTSVAATQTDPFFGAAWRRHFLSEEAGYVTLTPASGPVLRVPVHAAARPASTMSTTKTGINIGVGPSTGTKTLTLSGTGVNTGSNFSTTTAFPGQDEVSLVSVLELTEVSPELTPGPGPDDSADLRYVGIGKTTQTSPDEFGLTGDVLNFGIATYGDWSTAQPNDTEFDIFIDADTDGTPDLWIFNWDISSPFGGDSQDSYFTLMFELENFDGFVERRINGIRPHHTAGITGRDTVPLNNRVMVLSAFTDDMALLGHPLSGSFDYFVQTSNREAGFVDETFPHVWNIDAPGLSASGDATFGPFGAPMYNDLPATTIDVDYDRDAYNAADEGEGSKGLLLLHHHNMGGTQAQVINVVSEPQVAGDFDTSGKGDILWRNTSSGLNTIWFLDGTTVTSQAPITALDTSWQVGEVGDFDGDLDTDILWRRNTGENTIWLMDGSTVATTAPIATVGTAWIVAGAGDFDGDGRVDILWRNTVSGLNTIWFLNGGTVVSQAPTDPLAAAWQVADVGDFDGNGKADILFRNTSTGGNQVWLMDGTTATKTTIATVGTAWTVGGVGDFDGNGKSDILWRNTSSGLNTIWFMDGATVASQTPTVAVTNTAWKAHVTDVSGDAKADIVWRNEATGLNTIWLMDGATQTTAAPIQAVNTNWIIASPRP